jgi:hypothetical protein
MEDTIDLVTKPEEILKALQESQNNQTIVGLASPDLGPGIFMTFVLEMIHDGSGEVAVLNSYDITGYFLEKRKIPVKNISSVIPFRGVFVNPFLKQMHQASKTKSDNEMQNLDYIL